jgi:hypothetical protein
MITTVVSAILCEGKVDVSMMRGVTSYSFSVVADWTIETLEHEIEIVDEHEYLSPPLC